jgi:hypothetical protein
LAGNKIPSQLSLKLRMAINSPCRFPISAARV